MKQKLLLALLVGLVVICVISYMPPATNWNARQIEKIQQDVTKENFCFAVISDVHNNIPAFNKFLHALSPETRFIVVNGDFIHYGFNEEYHLALYNFRKTELPVLANIGNHEVQDGGRMMFKRIFGAPYYSFNISKNQFIFLDNSFGSIDVGQHEWLKNELSKDFEKRIIFIHIPPINPVTESLDILPHTPEHEILEEAFQEARVSFVVSGHIHSFREFEKDGVSYLITGSGGGETHRTWQEKSFSYAEFCLVDGEILVEKIDFAEQIHPMQLLNVSFIMILTLFYKIVLICLLIYFVVKYVFKKEMGKTKKSKNSKKKK